MIAKMLDVASIASVASVASIASIPPPVWDPVNGVYMKSVFQVTPELKNVKEHIGCKVKPLQAKLQKAQDEKNPDEMGRLLEEFHDMRVKVTPKWIVHFVSAWKLLDDQYRKFFFF